jgi:cytochrome b6-f complex iron-sulfur subunit
MKEIPVKPIDVQSSQPTSRRAFCQQCGAASLAALGLLVPGCGGGNPAGPSGVGAAQLPSISTTIANNAFMLTIDGSSPLNAVGSAALVQASGSLFLVAHTAQDTFTALQATCTHAACTITGFQGGNFICPCHGSVFSTSGQVLAGPAPRALPMYTTAFANGVLTVS